MKLEDRAEIQALIDSESPSAPYEAMIERIAEKYMLRIIDLRRENARLKILLAANCVSHVAKNPRSYIGEYLADRVFENTELKGHSHLDMLKVRQDTLAVLNGLVG
ncbi:MAG: hypothetical protein K2W95_01020 [Candidatus Obscuribacterales bacterium]|nr:hypothetical protein [Candidatus Obscuribacterales bacterium]